jgi:hypothetical protein
MSGVFALNLASLPFSMSTRTARMPRCVSTAASHALRMYWRARRRTFSSNVIAAPVAAETPGLNSWSALNTLMLSCRRGISS